MPDSISAAEALLMARTSWPPQEGRGQFRRGRDAVYRPGGVHRLRRLRAGLPGFGDFRLGRSAGEMGRVHAEERGVLREVTLRAVSDAGKVGFPKADRTHSH